MTFWVAGAAVGGAGKSDYRLPSWVNQQNTNNADFGLYDRENTNLSGTARFAPSWNVGFNSLPGYNAQALDAYGGDTSGDNSVYEIPDNAVIRARQVQRDAARRQ